MPRNPVSLVLVLVLLTSSVSAAVAVLVTMTVVGDRTSPPVMTAAPDDDAWRARCAELAARLDRLDQWAQSPAPGPTGTGADAERVARLQQQLDEVRAELAALADRAHTDTAAVSAPITRQDWLEAQTRITTLEQAVAALRQAIEDLAAGLQPRDPEPSNPGAAQWGAEQLLGAPDTTPGVDKPTAWAPSTADGGREWVEIDIDAAVAPDAIVIHETLNPGFVTRVEMQDASGYWHRVWSGTDPSTAPGGPLVVPVHNSFATRTVRVTLDTARRPGWNEIDAIGLRAGGTTHWATAARTSSNWSDNQGRGTSTGTEDDLDGLIDRIKRGGEIILSE